MLPLKHADAASVARAVNDAFQGQVTGDQRAPGARNQPRPRPQQTPERPEEVAPTLLVENEDWVRASAEPQTNSVIVSASRKNLAKVEEIITQLDVADPLLRGIDLAPLSVSSRPATLPREHYR